MIIAVDFDGTLCEECFPLIGEPKMELIQKLITRKTNGNQLILWTCRSGENLEKAVEWCKKYGLIFDAINDNLPEIVMQFGYNPRKIAAGLYIDDKSLNPITMEVL